MKTSFFVTEDEDGLPEDVHASIEFTIPKALRLIVGALFVFTAVTFIQLRK